MEDTMDLVSKLSHDKIYNLIQCAKHLNFESSKLLVFTESLYQINC